MLFFQALCFAETLPGIELLLEKKLEESGIRGPLIVKFRDTRMLSKNGNFDLLSFEISDGKTAEVILNEGGAHYKAFVNFENARYLAVPRSSIHHGALISEADITLAKFPVSRYRGDYASSVEELAGRITKKVLAQNKPIRLSDVKSIPVVKRGESISILYKKGGLSIEATGTALEDGGENEMIRVKNDDTNKTLNGKVLKNRVILVE